MIYGNLAIALLGVPHKSLGKTVLSLEKPIFSKEFRFMRGVPSPIHEKARAPAKAYTKSLNVVNFDVL